MKTVKLVLTKGPHRSHFGPPQWWDWKVSCRKALRLQEAAPDGFIYVPSAVSITGHLSELEYYANEFLQLGLELRQSTAEKLVLVNHSGMTTAIIERKGQETIEQIRLACELAGREHARLIVISTATHFFRVLYLCRGKGVEHRIALGVPNLFEAATDCILAVAFPILDILGQGQRFQQWAIRHRESGKHI